MNEANNRNWIVISMKNDWRTIFPLELIHDNVSRSL